MDDLDRVQHEDLGRPGRRGPSRAVERMMRIYGKDFMDAFGAMGRAQQLLDAGCVAESGSFLRFAAARLREAGSVNDHGRDPRLIVAEIVAVWEHFNREVYFVNFTGLRQFDRDVLAEVRERLGCDESRALGFLNAHYDQPVEASLVSHDDRASLEP